MWPAVYTCPDIPYSMGILSRYCSNPGPTHYSLMVQIVRYFFGTLNFGIIFEANSSDKLIGYTNSDYASLIDSRKSIGKYIFILSGAPLSYQSKLQNTVALLFTKGKYMAACKARKKALWDS